MVSTWGGRGVGGGGVIPVCTFHKIIRIRSVSISNIGLTPILCFANYINRQCLDSFLKINLGDGSNGSTFIL